jgi:hypothetical protein
MDWFRREISKFSRDWFKCEKLGFLADKGKLPFVCFWLLLLMLVFEVFIGEEDSFCLCSFSFERF